MSHLGKIGTVLAGSIIERANPKTDLKTREMSSLPSSPRRTGWDSGRLFPDSSLWGANLMKVRLLLNNVRNEARMRHAEVDGVAPIPLFL